MVERSAIIKNSQGIHCRPSALIVKVLRDFKGEVAFHSEEGRCDPRSIMALLSMGLQKGSRVRVEVKGPDEEALCLRLKDLLETEFDFPPQEEGAVARNQ
jgi:phosphotransferase system HPr (HPr) family protein